jgi:hypothetical protein
MTRISANRFDGNADAAIVLTGAGTPDAAVEVAHNLITAAGDGIRASMGRMKLHHNQVDGRDGGNAEHAGIVLVEGRDDAGIVDTECVANRVAGFRFAGIRIRADLRGLLCKQNQIVDCGNGIVFEREAVADRIAIDNNQVEARGGFALSAQLRLLGISVLGNRLVGSPRGVVLLGGVAGDIVFADNHSVRAQADGADGPDVLLRAQTVIASSNRMIGGGLSLDVHAGDRHYTIVGNIARGKIVLNGGNGIGAPWTSLNREGI